MNKENLMKILNGTFFQKLKTKLYEYIRIFNRRKPTNNS